MSVPSRPTHAIQRFARGILIARLGHGGAVASKVAIPVTPRTGHGWQKRYHDGMVSPNEQLIAAAVDGNVAEVAHAIAARADICVVGADALRHAAQDGHVEIVRMLLAAGANVHASNDDALRLAAGNAHIEVIKVLLAAGADIHASTDAPLYCAAQNGHLDAVRLLVTLGANTSSGALRTAAEENQAEVVRYLLAAGAEIDTPWGDAMSAAASGGHTQIVRILLAAGANIHNREDNALSSAAMNGHIETVRCLIDAGADVHASADAPLCLAASRGHVAVARILIAAGADAAQAWNRSVKVHRGQMVATLDACADVMAPKQRRSLAETPEPFVHIRAMVHSSRHHHNLQR